MRTPKESAWGNFFREKATFCEDERLVGQMISVPQLRVTDASRSAERHLRLKEKPLRWPRDLYCGGRVCGVLGRVRHRRPPSLRSKKRSKFFRAISELAPFFGRPKPKIPFLGLSLLRNHTETLATQAIAHQISTSCKQTAPFLSHLLSLLVSRNDLL